MNKNILIIITGLLSICTISAQEYVTISGIVREKMSREAFTSATVSADKINTATNEYGFFSLRAAKGVVHLSASYIGYSKYNQTFDVQKDTSIIIELKESAMLDEIIVEARQRTITSKGLGNVQLESSQLFKTPLFLGERDVVKAMQFLPGVSSGTEGSSQLNIRGGTNDQTLYLLDDVPVYNQNHTFGLFSIFNSEVIRAAELYKGGIPSQYGQRLSGVANVFLKNGNMNRHRQSITLGLLSFNAHAEGPIVKDKLSYSLAVRHSTYDLIMLALIARSDAAGGNVVFAFYDINAKLTWSISSKTDLSVQLYNGYDNMYNYSKEDIIDGDARYKFSQRVGLGWETLTSSINLKSSLRPNLYLVSNLYYTGLENFSYTRQQITYTNDKILNKYRAFDNLLEAGLKTRLEHTLGNNHQLYYGMELSDKRFKPSYMERIKDGQTTLYTTGLTRLQTLGFFVHDDLTLGAWQLSAGLRGSVYNNRKKSLFAVEPRIKIDRSLNANNKLMLAYDYMTQPIHSIHEMSYSIRRDFWTPFQEDRLPHSHQISVGWRNTSFSCLTFSVESYWKQMNNLIRIDNLESYIDYNTDYTTGSGRSFGAELLAQYDNRRLSAWLSYAWSKSTRTFGHKTVPFKYDMPHNLSLFAGYDVYQKNVYKNTLSINAQYHTGIPYTVSSTVYPGMGLPSYSDDRYGNSIMYMPNWPNTRLSDYFRADINFTAEKQLNKGGRRVWQFSLLNFTGHANPYAVYRNWKGKDKAFLLIPFLPSFSYSRYF